jgi:SAM-dependent methyltransferase
MTSPSSTEVPPRGRWQAPEAGGRYASGRWGSARREGRDPRLVASVLRRHLGEGGGGLVLDAPCGTGRLRPAIEQHAARWVGLDVSTPMLEAHAGDDLALVRGDVEHLPFPDDAFDAIVCCRLLHHLRDPEVLRRTVGELVRVSRDLVIASFWDAGALPSLRRRYVPGGRPARGRAPHAKGELRRVFADAGARIVGYRHSLRFLSRQTFAVARKEGGS